MSDTQIIFPLSEIQSEFLQARNDRATAMVQDAVRKVALDCHVPVGIDVAPNEELNALVVVPKPQQGPQPPNAPEETSEVAPTDSDDSWEDAEGEPA